VRLALGPLATISSQALTLADRGARTPPLDSRRNASGAGRARPNGRKRDSSQAGGLAPVGHIPSVTRFFLSIISRMMGVKMTSMARPILPPGATSVFGRDMKEP
jgi:hypothetical protein